MSTQLLLNLSTQRSADRQRSGASRVGGECSAVLGSPQVEQLPPAEGEAKRYPEGSPANRELACCYAKEQAQSRLDSNYIDDCTGLSYGDIYVFGKRTFVDEQLRELIYEVCRYENRSLERQKALNRLLKMIEQLPGLYKSSHQDYPQALNKTWEWVSREINKFKPQPPSVQQSLVIWINGYLKWRIKDLYVKENQYAISLDRAFSHDNGDQTTLIEQLSAPQPMSLSLLDIKIAQIQERERQRQGQAVKQYIEQDPEGRLKGCYLRRNPTCHCQILAVKLLLQEPSQKASEVARELNINDQTLYSHWKRKCIPLLQDIGRQLGYQL